MAVSDGLRSIMLADATVAGLVSARIYPKKAPQTSAGGTPRPYVVLHKTTRTPEKTLSGSSLSRSIWQIDAWADDFDQSETLGDAIETALDGFNGAAGGRALAIHLDQNFDDYEPDTDLFRQSLDVVVWDCGPA